MKANLKNEKYLLMKVFILLPIKETEIVIVKMLKRMRQIRLEWLILKCYTYFQELQSQQLSTVMRLESTVSGLVHEQNERELLEQALTQHDNKIRTVKKLGKII